MKKIKISNKNISIEDEDIIESGGESEEESNANEEVFSEEEDTNEEDTNEEDTNEEDTDEEDTNEEDTNDEDTNDEDTNEEDTNEEDTNEEDESSTPFLKQTNESAFNNTIDIGEPTESDSIKYLDAKIIKELLKKPKVTLPLITKFEYSKIKGIRITQLSNNANPFIKTTSDNIEEIADEEIKQLKLPFIIKRNLPNGEYELWRLNELAVR